MEAYPFRVKIYTLSDDIKICLLRYNVLDKSTMLTGSLPFHSHWQFNPPSYLF